MHIFSSNTSKVLAIMIANTLLVSACVNSGDSSSSTDSILAPQANSADSSGSVKNTITLNSEKRARAFNQQSRIKNSTKTSNNKQCNGFVALCDKKYNDVAYLTTHNAFNATRDWFRFPNQNKTITRQLADGVRGLMIDVYEDKGQIKVYHGNKILGSKPLSKNLGEIKQFLDNNPNEVITIIFEAYVKADQIEQELQKSGLDKYLYSKQGKWDTLATMIKNNTRLVILSDKNDAKEGQGWYHHVWKHAVETDFDNKKRSDLSCEFNRGKNNIDSKDLFIINHFITSYIGTGRPIVSSRINANPYLINRLNQCKQETGKLPNFVTVDFYEYGNSLQAVNMLNQVQ